MWTVSAAWMVELTVAATELQILKGKIVGDITEMISKYGFPMVAAVGLAAIIRYVWQWATKEVRPVISDANSILIALIDRIRCLDNDLLRLNQKVNTVLDLRGKTIEYDRVMAENQTKEADAGQKIDDTPGGD